jgi:hypothetical protein
MSAPSRIVVYASATSARTRTYPVPPGVIPARTHHWHGEAFHLVADLSPVVSVAPVVPVPSTVPPQEL